MKTAEKTRSKTALQGALNPRSPVQLRPGLPISSRSVVPNHPCLSSKGHGLESRREHQTALWCKSQALKALDLQIQVQVLAGLPNAREVFTAAHVGAIDEDRVRLAACAPNNMRRYVNGRLQAFQACYVGSTPTRRTFYIL